MPRFQIAGQKRNTLPQFESKVVQQGGDNGYDEASRGVVKGLAEKVKDVLKGVPDDANLSIAGSIERSGTALDVVLEIHANHPSMGNDLAQFYKEPDGVHNPDGSRGIHENADKRDEEKVEESKRLAERGATARTPTETPVVSGAPASPASGGFPARGTENGFEGASSPPGAAAAATTAPANTGGLSQFLAKEETK